MNHKMQDQMASPKINPLAVPSLQGVPRVVAPARIFPSFRVNEAFERGVANKFLINTWGGLGDQICAEPAIRFGLKAFKKCEVSLSSTLPSLFSHLNFKEVFDTRKVKPVLDNYLVFETITPPDTLLWEFCSHMLTHPVDFVSICMWRCQLPIAEREITMPDFPLTAEIMPALADVDNTVVIHAGKHWESKTFPKEWWTQVVRYFRDAGFTVVLIGHKVDANVGYVAIEGDGCIDLRDKLSIPEFVALLKNSKYVFSNDSAPIHAAASGDAFIGFVASCKHPDFLMHYRKGVFGYRAKNFGLDGIWNHIDYSPAQEEKVEAESLPPGLMDRILPQPQDVADFYRQLKERGGQWK